MIERYRLLASSLRPLLRRFFTGDARDLKDPNRRPPPVYRFFGIIWLIYLLGPVKDLLEEQPSDAKVAIGLLGATAFAAVYLYLFFSQIWSRPDRIRWSVVVSMTTLAVGLSTILGRDWLGLLVYATISAGIALPAPQAFRAIAALSLISTVLVFGMGGGAVDAAQLVIPGSLMALTIIFTRRLVLTVHELRAAREELARLAVTEERLRFARDLHDLLGHSLSLIVLKSELAQRLAATSPERAASEIGDIETVARRALGEVREAVAGYRQPVLAAELRGAEEMLAAAGVVFRQEGVAGVLPPNLEATLAWTVREGVTNIIRHSHASQVSIRFSRSGDWIGAEIVDDGEAARDLLPSYSTNSPGSGLPGLAERISALGGRFQAGTRSEGGFRLAVQLPIETTQSANYPSIAPILAEPVPVGAACSASSWPKTRRWCAAPSRRSWHWKTTSKSSPR